jgi:hypothetical protein
LCSTFDGIHYGGKLSEDAVACGVGYASSVLDDEAIHHLPVSRQRSKCARFVLRHEARVSGDICRENRC